MTATRGLVPTWPSSEPFLEMRPGPLRILVCPHRVLDTGGRCCGSREPVFRERPCRRGLDLFSYPPVPVGTCLLIRERSRGVKGVRSAQEFRRDSLRGSELRFQTCLQGSIFVKTHAKRKVNKHWQTRSIFSQVCPLGVLLQVE